MSKFENILTASDKNIKKQRAANVSETVSMECEDLVRKLKKERLSILGKIDSMSDLGPETTTSLLPTSKDFDAGKWVNELHELRLDLKLKEVELESAKSLMKEWFNED